MDMEERLAVFEDANTLSFAGLGRFRVMTMDRKWTFNTTSLRRVRTAKTLIFAGNCNGVIGYGKGTGKNMRTAWRNAEIHLRQNLVAINLDSINTWPKSLSAKFGKHEIIMWARKRFDSWGSPIFAAMIQMAGIHHCKFKVLYEEPNPYNLVYCFMKLLTQNTTPKILAEERGEKLYDTIWARRHGNQDLVYNIK